LFRRRSTNLYREEKESNPMQTKTEMNVNSREVGIRSHLLRSGIVREVKRRKIHIWLFALLLTTICFAALVFSTTISFATNDKSAGDRGIASRQQEAKEPRELAAFRDSVGGPIKPVIVELKDEPGVLRKVGLEQKGRAMPLKDLVTYSRELRGKQDSLLSSLSNRGVRALFRRTDVRQIDGSMRHIEYRFSYLLNGFVAYVASEDMERLRALPEVREVYEIQPTQLLLDKAIDYSLGTHSSAAERRLAVYGANQEFSPASGDPTHPEAPRTSKIDGFEGQGIKIAVIDSGVDWRHPMFGGIGQTTPLPRISGNLESPSDNKKVIYYYALSSPGDPTDDFGHGTLVASCAAGYSVDGNTPPRLGYGLGRDGTGVGPTPNNVQLFGTAPQAQIMAYKVCGPANACAGDIELAMEDAASPFTLVGTGDGGSIPTAVPKPVADVINLSLGDTAGDPAGASSRVANNAALAGTIVVASAGNAGPGAGTVGAPAAATLAISVAASLDPGSTAVGDVLAAGQVAGETGVDGSTGPPPETGAASTANQAQPGERQAMTLFPVAGGGPIPGGSLSSHYVFVDRRNAANPIPPEVRNRIALVKGGGTFAQIANAVAPFNPSGILIITTVESATAVAVLNGIPTFTMGPNNGDYLIDRMREGDPGDGDPNIDVPEGTISRLPLRLAESATFESFRPSMAGFSSRGPNDHDNARFRTIKPDVTGPGVGIVGAATVEGLPDDTVGLASHTGYTTANGTSFSGPITAGAMALIRQRVREELQLDTTNQADPQYRSKRFDTVTVARALLMNSATNLRSAFGIPEGDGAASIASINDMGAGHINVAGALAAKAIMVSPTVLLSDPREFTPPPGGTPGNLQVLIPSASFGAVPVVQVNATVVRTREVIIRDVTGGGGGGSYNLSFQNNRNADQTGFQITFTNAADSATPITSVTVPSGGQASFFVRVAANGSQINVDPTEFQWYVTATHASTGLSLRVPFYYRAVRPEIANVTSPVQQQPENTEQPTPDCPIDTNGNYRVRWTYTTPNGGPAPAGFRVQEATRSEQKFSDNADELLLAGANSKWAGSAQWTSQTNPNTGSLAYFVPDVANQNESLAMTNTVALPAGGATLSFTTTQNLEDDFDKAFVEVSTDGGSSFIVVASYGNDFVGTRNIDISPFAGQGIRVRFRVLTDLLNGDHDPAPLGWWVEDIRISSDDFRTIADVGPSDNSLEISGRTNATYFYRVAGLFDTAEGTAPGPYSNTQCVMVNIAVAMPDLRVTNMSASNGRAREGDKVTLTATVTNLGNGAASASKTEFLLDNAIVLGLVDTPAIQADQSTTVSINWDTRSVKGTHTIRGTADQTGLVGESNETNNSSMLTVTIQGNKVKNGSFEQPGSNGSSPEAWSGSNTNAGTTSWSNGGSDGAKSVTITGNGGNVVLSGSPSWTSDPVSVIAGQSLSFSVSVKSTGASSAATAGLVYLGAAGQILNTITLVTAPVTTAGFNKLERLITIPQGVAQVYVKLIGFAPTDTATAGTVTFDEVGLFESDGSLARVFTLDQDMLKGPLAEAVVALMPQKTYLIHTGLQPGVYLPAQIGNGVNSFAAQTVNRVRRSLPTFSPG
jgi:hypothetical protein